MAAYGLSQATLETPNRRENPSSEIEGSITSWETELCSLRADEISNNNVAPSPPSSSPTVALANVSAFPRSIEALETAARETIEQAMPVWQEQTKLSHDSASMDAKISSVLAQLRRDYNNKTNNNNNTINGGNTNSRTYNNYPATAPKVASGATAS